MKDPRERKDYYKKQYKPVWKCPTCAINSFHLISSRFSIHSLSSVDTGTWKWNSRTLTDYPSNWPICTT